MGRPEVREHRELEAEAHGTLRIAQHSGIMLWSQICSTASPGHHGDGYCGKHGTVAAFVLNAESAAMISSLFPLAFCPKDLAVFWSSLRLSDRSAPGESNAFLGGFISAPERRDEKVAFLKRVVVSLHHVIV